MPDLSVNPARSQKDGSHVRRLNIVIADDEPDAVLTLSALLEDEGHKVIGLHDGADVIKALVTYDPDAVALDINMPGMSGFAVAQQVRQAYGAEAPLLIAVSGRWRGQTDRMLGRLSAPTTISSSRSTRRSSSGCCSAPRYQRKGFARSRSSARPGSLGSSGFPGWMMETWQLSAASTSSR